MFINYAYEPERNGRRVFSWMIWWDDEPFMPDDGNMHWNESVWAVPGTLEN